MANTKDGRDAWVAPAEYDGETIPHEIHSHMQGYAVKIGVPAEDVYAASLAHFMNRMRADRAADPIGFERKRRKAARGVAANPRLRFQVLQRDKFICQYCGAMAPDVELQVDHINPISRGGHSGPDNLTTACKECNQGKAALTLEGFDDA